MYVGIKGGMGLWIFVLVVVVGRGCGCVLVRRGEVNDEENRVEMVIRGRGKEEFVEEYGVRTEENVVEGNVCAVELEGMKTFTTVDKRKWVVMRRDQTGKKAKLRVGRKLRVEKVPSQNAVKRAEKDGASYEMSVYAGVGQFLGLLKIGTPPVSFTAIVDTGSDLVWRQCKPCKHCYPQTDYGFPIFNPALSSTFRKASCNNPLCPAAQTYGGTCAAPNRTCSYDSLYDDPHAFTRGDLAFDTLSISDSSGRLHGVSNFAFGCSYESHGPYNFAGSGGIVGFGEGKLALPSQLGITRFSYCLMRLTSWSIDTLQRQPEAAKASSPSVQRQRSEAMASPPFQLQHRSLSPSLASPLFLGDEAYLGPGPDIQSTRIVEQGYIVELLAIRVAGRRLNISRSLFRGGGTLIDSGTTFTTLPVPAFHALYSAFRKLIHLTPWSGAGPRNLSLCYSSLPSPIPSLTFQFKGAHQLRLRPHNYFVLIDNLYCLAILETEDSRAIYGNVQQQDFHILYDLQSRLISFKRTSCSSLHHR